MAVAGALRRLAGGLCSPGLLQFRTTIGPTSCPAAQLPGGLVARGVAARHGATASEAALAEALSATTLRTAPARRRSSSVWADLKALSKLRLSLLVTSTASAGYVLGSPGSVDLPGLGWLSLGTLGAAACANALNQLYEARNDACMQRTRNRPLPTGRMAPRHAAAFALAAGSAGLAVLYYKVGRALGSGAAGPAHTQRAHVREPALAACTPRSSPAPLRTHARTHCCTAPCPAQSNPLTAGLGAANIALYAAVYTPLKQLTVANTWVGALVGAIPPLMGWAASAGALEPGAAVLAAGLFCWQMPHFMALAWLCRDDYRAGGFRMLSALDATGRRTAAVGLRHALALVPLGVGAEAAGVATSAFAWEAAALGAMLVVPAARFVAAPSQAGARGLFRASLLYLPLALAGAVVHRVRARAR